MGIRVNKELGWVLTGHPLNLEVLESLTLADLKKEFEDDYELCHLDLVYPNIDLSQKLINFVNDISDEFNPQDHCFIFTPPVLGDEWSRHDSPLDYYECEDASRQIKYLYREIFPYAQKFVVSSSLNYLNETQKKMCWYFSDLGHQLKPDVQTELSNLGLNINQSLKSQIHMTAPKILELILKKCNSNLDYRILRPALVTYWR